MGQRPCFSSQVVFWVHENCVVQPGGSSAKKRRNIVRWTDVEERGGHFAALEEPGLLLDDVREFFRSLW